MCEYNKYAYIRAYSALNEMSFLKNINVFSGNIFFDNIKGGKRDKYKLLLSEMSEGDVLYIRHIKTLGKTYDEIFQEWRMLTKVKKVKIIVWGMPAINTFKEGIADVVYQMLLYNKRKERRQYEQRCARKYAEELKKLPLEFWNALDLFDKGVSGIVAAQKCNMKHSSFLYYRKMIEKRKIQRENFKKHRERERENDILALPTTGFEGVYEQWANGEITAIKAADICKMSRYEFSKRAHIKFKEKITNYTPSENITEEDDYLDELERLKKERADKQLRYKVLQYGKKYKKGMMSLSEAAKQCYLSESSFETLLKDYLNEG